MKQGKNKMETNTTTSVEELEEEQSELAFTASLFLSGACPRRKTGRKKIKISFFKNYFSAFCFGNFPFKKHEHH